MECSRVVIIGVHLKDPSSQLQYMIADVVLIDQSHQALQPSLYQLQAGLEPLAFDLNRLPKGSFVMLGEVNKIDKKNKKIYLSNQSIVQYKHLIIICKTGLQHNDHFNDISVIKTLVDALKLQQKAPILLASPDSQYLKTTTLSSAAFLELSPSLHSDLSKNIGKIAQHLIAQEEKNQLSCNSMKTNKRLVEVHL